VSAYNLTWPRSRSASPRSPSTPRRRAYLHALCGSLTASDGDDLTRHFGAARAAASQGARSKIHSLQPRTDVEKPRLPDESES
jgi:hypothetical protein